MMADELQHLNLQITGIVQGVGFRPFVSHLAKCLGLAGSVKNNCHGVLIDIEGAKKHLDEFLVLLRSDAPRVSRIDDIKVRVIPLEHYKKFQITASQDTDIKHKSVLIPADLATCPDCVKELFEETNPRYRYPFINCTQCGPRYSIISNLPYDRNNTSMKNFTLCESCQTEYEDSDSRRYHAEPNACPLCGPQLSFLNSHGKTIAKSKLALNKSMELLRSGSILAIKGIGGFHLVADANNDAAISQLRQIKSRARKPLAIMAPNIAWIREAVDISSEQENLLQGPVSPILLLPIKNNVPVSVSALVAPNNPFLGIMLPYTPLHYLLLADFAAPLVFTSANQRDESICINESELLSVFAQTIDAVLTHDRPILRALDDSIIKPIGTHFQVIRNARGLAPVYLPAPKNQPRKLAMGAQQKSSFCFTLDNTAIVSQHLGELSNKKSFNRYCQEIDLLQSLYQFQADTIAIDKHPDYQSSHYGLCQEKSSYSVQHHLAHLLACSNEHQVQEDILGFIFDGTGLGLDNTVWGAEVIYLSKKSDSGKAKAQRLASLLPFPLLGGEKAISDGRYAMIGLLYQCYGEELFATHMHKHWATFSSLEKNLLSTLLKNNNYDLCSSMGRLFDGVSALCGIRLQSEYEAEAAIDLENVLSKHIASKDIHKYSNMQNHIALIKKGKRYDVDWRGLVKLLVNQIAAGTAKAELSLCFHQAIIDIALLLIRQIKNDGIKFKTVALSGGCFQNRYLLENLSQRIESVGLKVIFPQRLPCNDGGISYGQLFADKVEFDEY